MRHSLALVTGTTSGVGYAAAIVEALLRSGPNVKYEPHRAYADAKCIVAWWAAALARRLPTRKPRGRPWSRSPASTSPPQHP